MDDETTEVTRDVDLQVFRDSDGRIDNAIANLNATSDVAEQEYKIRYRVQEGTAVPEMIRRSIDEEPMHVLVSNLARHLPAVEEAVGNVPGIEEVRSLEEEIGRLPDE